MTNKNKIKDMLQEVLEKKKALKEHFEVLTKKRREADELRNKVFSELDENKDKDVLAEFKDLDYKAFICIKVEELLISCEKDLIASYEKLEDKSALDEETKEIVESIKSRVDYFPVTIKDGDIEVKDKQNIIALIDASYEQDKTKYTRHKETVLNIIERYGEDKPKP